MIGLFLGLVILGVYLFVMARAKHCPKGCHGCGKCMEETPDRNENENDNPIS